MSGDRIERIKAALEMLYAWTDFSFHPDQQLNDEILIAVGWQVEPDPKWEDGERWFVGTNPVYSTGPRTRPRPLHSIDSAASLLPRHWHVDGLSENSDGSVSVRVTRKTEWVVAEGKTEQHARAIAALLAILRDIERKEDKL